MRHSVFHSFLEPDHNAEFAVLNQVLDTHNVQTTLDAVYPEFKRQFDVHAPYLNLDTRAMISKSS